MNKFDQRYQADNRPRRAMAREAYRFWAFVGGLERYKQLIIADIVSRERVGSSGGISKPTEAELLRIEERYDACRGALNDLEAVELAFKQMEAMPNGKEMRGVVMTACCKQPSRRLVRNDLSARISIASIELHIAERTAWRMLAQACDMYAANRGLKL